MRDEATSIPVDPPGESDDSLLCVSCGYQLRGLDPAGVCPECGTPIARSREGERLAAADPAWLNAIARGQHILAVATHFVLYAMLTLLIGAVVFTATYAFEAVGGRITWFNLDRLAGAAAAIGTFAFYAVLLLGAIAGAIGLFLVTMQDPREQQREPLLSARRTARAGAVGFVISSAMAATMRSLVWFGGPALKLLQYLNLLAVGMTLTCMLVGTLYWLASIARRAPAPDLERRTAAHAKLWGLALPIMTIWIVGQSARPLGAPMSTPLGQIIKVAFLLFGCMATLLTFALIVESISVVRLMRDYRRMLEEIARGSRDLADRHHRGDSPAWGSSSGGDASPSGPTDGS